MKKVRFYDTNGVIDNIDNLKNEYIYISSITLQELEHIKVSKNKDGLVKFNARKASRYFRDNEDKYKCIIIQDKHYKLLEDFKLVADNDNLIVASAYLFEKENNVEVEFVTRDICCFNIAKNIFNLKTADINIKQDDYKGFVEVNMTKEELANWYENQENKWNLIDNEYLLIKNENNEVVDRYKFIDNTFLHINVDKYISSSFLGDFRPRDEYQMLALETLQNNKISLIKGRAGTGKSLIALSFLLHQLRKGEIDKIIIFVNSPKVKGSTEIGFLPGTREEKLLSSQIGNFLISKLGDISAVQMLMSRGQLELLPMSDIRGYDTSGMKASIYLTESQNTSIEIMRLALQRIGEDCTCIIDGDYTTQVDDVCFQGANNGMKRVSEVFRGTKVYGEVELQNIYRSEIAKIAEKM